MPSFRKLWFIVSIDIVNYVARDLKEIPIDRWTRVGFLLDSCKSLFVHWKISQSLYSFLLCIWMVQKWTIFTFIRFKTYHLMHFVLTAITRLPKDFPTQHPLYLIHLAETISFHSAFTDLVNCSTTTIMSWLDSN